jgi:anaerobic sulfite reductase subunit C
MIPRRKFTVAIAGCANGCTDPHVADFALIGFARIGIASELCNNCRKCVAKCKEKAITISEVGIVIDRERCLGCPSCVQVCRTGALTIADRGWQVLVGGQLGRHPHLAETWLPFADNQTVRRAFVAALEFWLAESNGARLGEILSGTGLPSLQARYAASSLT